MEDPPASLSGFGRVLIVLAPLVAGGSAAFAAVFGVSVAGFGVPRAAVPAVAVAGLSAVALALFAGAVTVGDRWSRAYLCAQRSGHRPGLGRGYLSRHRNLADVVEMVAGSGPPWVALAVLLGSAAWGATAAGLNLAAVGWFGGTSVALQAPIGLLGFTAFFTVASFVISRPARAEAED
ncbi:hypothetical protein [Mycolicibacillus trivialis]|uniref:Uncharacterized protein n=1 Tax=Mycolicibacillus trivialis TaxID=1798 RepID=A0A1X2EE58_9MYCO|nr:hypothetical protein [Mycolicibacillus trivialis]ORW99204.1 hypothetical protein AWC30_16940 [Mycolicibacillus trivialis]